MYCLKLLDLIVAVQQLKKKLTHMPYIALALLNLNLGLFFNCTSICIFKILVKAHLDLILSELEKGEAQ